MSATAPSPEGPRSRPSVTQLRILVTAALILGAIVAVALHAGEAAVACLVLAIIAAPAAWVRGSFGWGDAGPYN